MDLDPIPDLEKLESAIGDLLEKMREASEQVEDPTLADQLKEWANAYQDAHKDFAAEVTRVNADADAMIAQAQTQSQTALAAAAVAQERLAKQEQEDAKEKKKPKRKPSDTELAPRLRDELLERYGDIEPPAPASKAEPEVHVADWAMASQTLSTPPAAESAPIDTAAPEPPPMQPGEIPTDPGSESARSWYESIGSWLASMGTATPPPASESDADKEGPKNRDAPAKGTKEDWQGWYDSVEDDLRSQ